MRVSSAASGDAVGANRQMRPRAPAGWGATQLATQIAPSGPNFTSVASTCRKVCSSAQISYAAAEGRIRKLRIDDVASDPVKSATRNRPSKWAGSPVPG